MGRNQPNLNKKPRKEVGKVKGKWLSVAGALIILGVAALTGCGKSSSPVQVSKDVGEIISIINSSGYTDSVGFGGTNDGTNTPQGFAWGRGGGTLPDTTFLQPVRFARWYTGNTRSLKIDSLTANRTKAWVTITHDLSGNFFDNSSFPFDPFKTYIRPITDDRWVRHVYLEKNNAGVWRLMRISPIDAQSMDSPYPITIVSVEAYGSPSGVHYVITKADSLYAKDELPTFQPGDSVTVKVTVSVQGDSSWVFLHRWGRPWPWHIRQPFYRTSLTTFQRTWVIADEDSVYHTPAVRHAVLDAIGMRALFGDVNQQYSAHGWGLPYVVKNTGDPYPE